MGAQYNDGNGASSGHVRVYQWLDGSWTQLIRDLDGELAGDTSGYSVALSGSGNRVAVGAVGNDGTGDMAGHVRVYELVGRIPAAAGAPAPVVARSAPITGSSWFSLSSAQVAAWNGWELDKDWALNFKFKKGATTFQYLFRWS